MKKIYFCSMLLFMLCFFNATAQNKMGDNPTSVQAGSLLELESATKGLRLPRIALNDVTKWTLDGTAVSGMLIFNDSGTSPKGLYYWNSDMSQWVQVQNVQELVTLLANKVDKEPGKGLSTNDYTTLEKNKLAAITGTNTGDQDLTPYAKTTDVNAAMALKEDLANKSVNIDADAASDTKYPSVKSIKTYVDVAVAGATIADADAITKGKIQLAGDLGGTASAPTVPGLINKADKTTTVNGYPLSGNVTITKTDVGLGNVDNTSDINKPVSTATQTALDTKENVVNAGTVSQYYRGDKTWATLDKTIVGLGNVDNTSDVNKPVSTATQSALDLKADKTITVNGQPLSANVSLSKTDVGLANVDNTSDINKPISTLTQAALDTKEAVINAGTVSQYYRGDKTWATLDKTIVGLGNVDNTSDVNKPVSTAAQSALDLKADKTITVNGQPLSANVSLSKTDVGLANVDNTSDINKPISTATQTALDLKAPLVSPTLTGTPTAPTAAAATNNTQIATTEFVTTAVAAATIPDADATTKGKLKLAGDLGGTAAAPVVVANAITTSKIADGAITSSKLSSMGATTSGDLLTWNGSAWTSSAATAATTTSKGVIQLGGDLAGIGSTASTPKITDGAITTSKLEGLANGQIIVGVDGTSAGNAKVPVTGDVTMLNSGVTSISTDAVTTTKIKDAAVTLPKMANVSATSLIGNSTSTSAAPQSIAIGSGLSFSGSTLTAINKNLTIVNSPTYTIAPTDFIIKSMYGSGGPNLTLPDAATSIGRTLIVIEGTGVNTVTFDPAGPGLIVGATQSVGAGLTYLMICDGTNWRICAQ